MCPGSTVVGGESLRRFLLGKQWKNQVLPSNYRLFQVADLICTLELTLSKIEMGQISNTEDAFFHGAHEFKKGYWRKIKTKEL